MPLGDAPMAVLAAALRDSSVVIRYPGQDRHRAGLRVPVVARSGVWSRARPLLRRDGGRRRPGGVWPGPVRHRAPVRLRPHLRAGGTGAPAATTGTGTSL